MTRAAFIRFMRMLLATLATGIVIWLLAKLGVNLSVPTPHP